MSKQAEIEIDPDEIDYVLKVSQDPAWIKTRSPMEMVRTCPGCGRSFFQKVFWDGSRSKHNCEGGTILK